MEFYKEYADGGDFLAIKELNEDVKNNPQWKSSVKGYVNADGYTLVLVRWVGLSETPFKEVKE